MHAYVHEVLVMDIRTQHVYCPSGRMFLICHGVFGCSKCLSEKGSNPLGALSHSKPSCEVKR